MREAVNEGWSEKILNSGSNYHKYGGHIWIGRDSASGLTSTKSQSHFPQIKKHTGMSYDKMLFFDDSNWSDNCGEVERNCKGVVSQRTPHGMQIDELFKGLEKFSSKYS